MMLKQHAPLCAQGLKPAGYSFEECTAAGREGKVLDVSEYIQDGNDKRWEHLVWAYDNVYPSLEGKSYHSGCWRP